MHQRMIGPVTAERTDKDDLPGTPGQRGIHRDLAVGDRLARRIRLAHDVRPVGDQGFCRRIEIAHPEFGDNRQGAGMAHPAIGGDGAGAGKHLFQPVGDGQVAAEKNGKARHGHGFSPRAGARQSRKSRRGQPAAGRGSCQSGSVILELATL